MTIAIFGPGPSPSPRYHVVLIPVTDNCWYWSGSRYVLGFGIKNENVMNLTICVLLVHQRKGPFRATRVLEKAS